METGTAENGIGTVAVVGIHLQEIQRETYTETVFQKSGHQAVLHTDEYWDVFLYLYFNLYAPG